MITINNLQDADDTLRRIGRLQRDIATEETLLNDVIENLKTMTKQKVDPLQAELDAASQTLLNWIRYERRQIISGTTKSKELTYGTIGVRDSTPVPRAMPGVSGKEIAKGLLKAGLKGCVKIEYKWIKNAVKGLDERLRPRLERIGIRFTKVKKDRPFFTINEEKIAGEYPVTTEVE